MESWRSGSQGLEYKLSYWNFNKQKTIKKPAVCNIQELINIFFFRSIVV